MKAFTILFFLVLVTSKGFALTPDTVVYNGKTYFVYPQRIQNGYYDVLSILNIHHELNENDNGQGGRDYFNENTNITLSGLQMPPILDEFPDGDYILYHERDCKYKRHAKGEKQKCSKDKIYAIFNIKNSKKEGKCSLFNSWHQKTIKAVFTYKNDELNGPAYVHDKHYYVSNKNGDLKVFNMKDGVLHGDMKVYIIRHKDSHLVVSTNLEMGKLNGPYYKLDYTHWHNFKVYDTIRGAFAMNKRHGVWSGGWINHTYDSGRLLSTKKLFTKHSDVYFITYYGLQNVKKYCPEFESYKTNLYISANKKYTYREDYYNKGQYTANSGWIFFDYVEPDSQQITMLYSKDSVSINNFIAKNRIYVNPLEWNNFVYYFYDLYGGYYTVDSVNGQLQRTYLYNKSFGRKYSYTYVVKYDDSEDEPCYWQYYAYTTHYNKRKIKRIEYNSYYLNELKKDSVYSELKETIQKRNYQFKRYVYKPLDFEYADEEVKKHGKPIYQLKHQIKGEQGEEEITRKLCLYFGQDTLTILDTLAFEGKMLKESDPVSVITGVDLLNNFLMTGFKLKANSKQSIALNDKPYTGEVNFKMKYKGNRFKLKSNFNAKEAVLNINVVLEKEYKQYKRYSNFVMPIDHSSFVVKDGKLNGTALVSFVNGKLLLYSYAENALDAHIELPLYKIKKKAKESRLFQENKLHNGTGIHDYTLSNTQSFTCIKGKHQGYWSIYSEKKPKSNYRYSYMYSSPSYDGIQNKQNLEEILQFIARTNYYQYSNSKNTYSYVYDTFEGIQTIQDPDNTIQCTAKDNVLNGLFTVHNTSNGVLLFSGFFVNGFPHGQLDDYSYREGNKANHLNTRYTYDSGRLKQSVLYFSNSNQIKRKIVFDSSYLSSYSGFLDRDEAMPKIGPVSLLDENFYNIFQYYRSLEVRTGISSSYYQSGALFKKGVLLNEMPQGVWTIYRENNSIYKLLEYKDSSILTEDQLTYNLFNVVTAFYPNGKLMYRGYAMSADVTYDCETEQELPTEDIFYLSFYDSSGNPTLVNGTGKIKEFQVSGLILHEGELINYKKEGLWLTYDQFGHLTRMGYYKNGRRDGRWLEGDLSGIKLPTDICFMDQESYQRWMQTNAKNISIEVTQYRDGVIQSTQSLNLKSE